jgi:hypothetical protein
MSHGITHFNKVCGVHGLYVGHNDVEVLVADEDGVLIQNIGGVPYYYWGNSTGALRYGTVKPTALTIDTAGAPVDTDTDTSGITQYANFFQTVADVGATIAADNGKALFHGPGASNTAGFTMVADSGDITVTNAGVYKIDWEITCAEAGAMSLYVGAAKQAGTCFGTGAGTQNINGTALLTLGAGAVVSLRSDNCPAALTLQLAGTTNTAEIVCSISLLKIA